MQCFKCVTRKSHTTAWLASLTSIKSFGAKLQQRNSHQRATKLERFGVTSRYDIIFEYLCSKCILVDKGSNHWEENYPPEWLEAKVHRCISILVECYEHVTDADLPIRYCSSGGLKGRVIFLSVSVFLSWRFYELLWQWFSLVAGWSVYSLHLTWLGLNTQKQT